MCWKILPHGTRELIGNNSDGGVKLLHDLNQIFSDFVPRCGKLLSVDIPYDWDITRGIDAAYMIAGDLYLRGKMHQSVYMVFFASILCEFVSDSKQISTLPVTLNDFLSVFAHIRLATVNTRTTKLLRDFLSEVHPSKAFWKHKLSEEAKAQSPNSPLFSNHMPILDQPKRKLITLFMDHRPDVYRECQVYEDSTLTQLSIVWFIIDTEDDDDETETFKVPAGRARRLFLTRPKSIVKVSRNTMIQVNGESDYPFISIYANKTLRQLGINEGDRFKCQLMPTVKMDEEDGEAVQQETKKSASRNAKKQQSGRGKMKRKTNTPSNPPPSNQEQEPTRHKQQLKEAHSKLMEPVLNEMRPQLQPIRRKLDSLTLQRRLPKQKKGPKVISNDDKENVCNFTNILATSGGKAGKIAFPIVVGQVTNLFNSSKPSRSRNSRRYKIISLDLHGLSKKQALEKLNENLPRWVDTAMKGENPWVIPIDIICGGGNQVLSEVVTAWIRSEHQVANRPKSYFM